ncbi:hypothetical protein [Sabulicella rubraurantiaca]|uniref:hypothetical protein n=1 Tax=Sabulicella rubraurantiaca TaxID=2811429 RepID=UPI001A96E664|nr:hypothetical protein [Sabulicella rubraurantiaca]
MAPPPRASIAPVAAIALTLLSAACSWPDYTPVRDWAGTASTTVDYPVVAVVCAPAEVSWAPEDPRRLGLRAMQEALTTYLRALTILADDGALPYRENPFAYHLVPRAATVSEAGSHAVAALGALLREATIRNAQAPQLADMIKAADSDVQTLVAALAAVLPPDEADAPHRTATAEAYAALVRATHDPAAQQAVRDVAALRDREFAAREASRALYARALLQVGEGHALLNERASRLPQEETARQVRATRDQLMRLAAFLPRTPGGLPDAAPCPPPPPAPPPSTEPASRQRRPHAR